MAYAYSEVFEKVRQWASQHAAEHRLEDSLAQRLLSLDQRSPDQLFGDTVSRPLIVAFMGGTGVGKSSLINRLAGQEVAKTGVERPTSREVTLYHHHAVILDQLPNDLPLDKINVRQHMREEYRNLLWIDTPDFDSIEAGNKELVLQWLPHIDVLLYVVSPDRYRDSKAWQLLLAEGGKHAWIFVFNQWDRGLPAQYDDFKKQLTKAGFKQPLIFRTDCINQQGDEFEALVSRLAELATGENARVLEQRGKLFLLQQLRKKLQECRDVLEQREFERLDDFRAQAWRKTVDVLQKGFRWPIKQMAVQCAQQARTQSDIKIWDDWARTRFGDFLDEIVLHANQLSIPIKALRQDLTMLETEIEALVDKQTELHCRQALINPGNRLHRWMLLWLRLLEFLLPVTAMGFVGYQVFTQFYQSAQQGGPYLGVDFAVHSVLLISICWLVPFFLHRKLQPSLEKAALSGINKGIHTVFAELDDHIQQVLRQHQDQHQQMLQQLEQLQRATGALSEGNAGAGSSGGDLDRILLELD